MGSYSRVEAAGFATIGEPWRTSVCKCRLNIMVEKQTSNDGLGVSSETMGPKPSTLNPKPGPLR